MIQFAALTLGLLTSFVLSSLHLNNKRQQKSPDMLVAMGHFLMGVSATISALLFGAAAYTLLH